MIDWTERQDISKILKKTILNATFVLTKDNALDALRCDYIFINGKHYKTPKNGLLDLLRNCKLRDEPIRVNLELEEVDL
jgi:hypothetical protein